MRWKKTDEDCASSNDEYNKWKDKKSICSIRVGTLVSQALQLKSLRMQSPSGHCRENYFSVRKRRFIFMLENLGCGAVRA